MRIFIFRDNSPMYLNAFNDTVPEFENGKLLLYDCQQNFLFVAESRALQVMGKDPRIIGLLKEQADRIADLANSTLWDGTIFRQVDASAKRRGFSPAISPT